MMMHIPQAILLLLMAASLILAAGNPDDERRAQEDFFRQHFPVEDRNPNFVDHLRLDEQSRRVASNPHQFPVNRQIVHEAMNRFSHYAPRTPPFSGPILQPGYQFSGYPPGYRPGGFLSVFPPTDSSHVLPTSITSHSPEVAAGSHQAIHGAHLPSLRSDDMTWESSQTEAGTSHGAPEMQHQVPRFRHLPSGNIYGPLEINTRRFSMQPYPLDTPFFRELHSENRMKPVNFEDFFEANNRYRSSDTIFRPEPGLLQAIQLKIWNHLNQQRVRPQKVLEQYPLRQGEYLWPANKIRSSERRALTIADNFGHTAIRSRLKARLDEHTPNNPTIFHLKVPKGRQTRDIMMFKVRTERFVGVPTPRNLNSDLWMFLEAYRPRYGMTTENPTALLGTAFLPKSAQDLLSQDGTIVPAFPRWLERGA